MQLYSEPGHGTTVTVLLPSVDAPATEKPTPAKPARRRPAAGQTILVVEDQPALRAVTARMLADAGYAVVAADDGADAVSIAQNAEHRIDLLLSHVVMPDLLGQELAGQLREIRPGLNVVFMSGFARRLLPDAGHPLDGPLLLKPFTETELLDTIADELEQAG